MEMIAYILLGIVAFCWLCAMLIGLVAAMPFGLIGLIAILAIGLLLIKVFQERVANKEDDYYADKIER